MLVGDFPDSETVSSSFKVTLIGEDFKDQAPEFEEDLKNQMAMCTFLWQYELPQAKDKENNQFTMSMKIDQGASNFVTFDGSTINFNPNIGDN